MTIAIQSGLENLAQALRGYGFDDVTYGEYRHPVDALVYSGAHMPLRSAVNNSHEQHGVFMVNANGKSAEEVAAILNRRTYTPLF